MMTYFDWVSFSAYVTGGNTTHKCLNRLDRQIVEQPFAIVSLRCDF